MLTHRDHCRTSLVRRIKKRLPDKIVSVSLYRRRSLSGSTDASNSRIYDYKALTENGAADSGTQSGTCPGNGIVASSSLPSGASSTEYNWFETQISCCAASSQLPLWVAAGTTASPTLPRAFHSVRVSGIAGSKVFEAKADPVRSGCP